MNSSAAGTPPPSLSQPVVSPSAMPYGISQSTGGPASSAFASAAVPNGIFGFPQQLHGVHPHGYYAIGTPSMAGAGMYPSHLYQHQPHPGLMGSPGLFQPAVAAPQPPYVAGGAYPYYGWPAAAPPPGLFYHPSAGVPPTASPAAAAMAPVPTTAAAFGAGPTPPPHVIQTASSVEAPQRGGANGHTNGSSTGSSESKTGTPVSGNGQRPSTQQTRSSHGSGGTAAAEQHSSGNGHASPNGHHRHRSSANGAVAPSRANGQPSSATRHHAANGNGHGAAFDGNFDVSCSNRAIVENRQLVVKFLTDETNEKQFRELFERFGPVDNARIIYDRKTNHTKGFGFITYKHTEHAVQALRNMGGYQLHGRQLNVALAQTERKRAFSTEELLAPPPAATPAAAAAGDAPNTTGATSGATEAMAGASAPGTAAALAASARPAGATTATLTTTATHRNRGVQAGPVRSPVGSSNNVTSGSSGADDDTAPTNGNSSNNSGGGVHHEAHAGGKSSADAAMPTPANGPTGTDTASTTDSSNRGGSGHDGRNNARSDNDSGSSGHHERLSSSPPTVDAAAAATSSQQGRDGDRGSPATPTTSDPAGTSSPKSSSTPPNASTPTSDRNSL